VITRLRPAYTAAELAELYAVPHAHGGWPDHRLRVAGTIALARDMGVPEVVADLSCGDAAIGRALAPGRLILGDIAPGYELCGPIEQTVHMIQHVGMFICSETIEHLDDPAGILEAIRAKAGALVLSTPLGETTGRNREHYWGWDDAGVRTLLLGTGWAPVDYREVHYVPEPGEDWLPASYQLWGCR
jgi:hypothetical protein